MFLVVGLGNPGEKYKNTRHNAGQMAADAVLGEWRTSAGFSDFKLDKKSKTLISKGMIGKEKVFIGKPQVFMNNSGQAVKKLFTLYRLAPTNLLVIHDDIDLPLGEIRIVKGRGSAGHKGVESIMQEIKNSNFIRFRIGIKPRNCDLKSKSLDKFVLQKFTKQEEEIMKKAASKTVGAIKATITEGPEKAMNEYNR